MDLIAGCPNCGASKKFPESAAGKLAVCGACDMQLQIPIPCEMPQAKKTNPDETAAIVNINVGTHELIWIHGVATMREKHREIMSGRLKTKNKPTSDSAVIRSLKKARSILSRMLSSLRKSWY